MWLSTRNWKGKIGVGEVYCGGLGNLLWGVKRGVRRTFWTVIFGGRTTGQSGVLTVLYNCYIELLIIY